MTSLWKNDDDLFALVRRELFTCVVGDVMDKLQLLHQFLPPQIHPLHGEMVTIGRAMPVLSTDVFAEKVSGSANKLMEKPFGLMLEALDDLRRHEIYLEYRFIAAQRFVGRINEHARDPAGRGRRGGERICARHEEHSENEFSDFLFWFVRAGLGAAL